MDKKETINLYKNRKRTGGVFAIKNTVLNKWFVDCTNDIGAAKNRFDFMGDSYTKIARDYKAQNGEGFIFEVLEELEKGETQTEKEFKDDVVLLKSLWLEKLTDRDLY